jgi:tetratricopeptide (TPR) repeat protein
MKKRDVMRRCILFAAALFVSCAACVAQKLPKKVDKARQSVASIMTFKDGVVVGNGTAVLAGNSGEAIVSYTLMCGADSAVMVDNKGKIRPVTGIVGLNNLYDCAKVRMAADKKIVNIPLAHSAVSEGDVLYMISYGKKKSGTIESVKVTAVDSFYSHAYYTLDVPVQERYVSLPLVNAEGELVAMVQPVSAGDSTCYAIGATVADELVVSSVTYGRGKYSGMGIRTLLPAEKEEALSCMYMQTMIGDSVSYRNAVNDFIGQFPESHEGYVCDAEHKALYCRDMAAAEEAWDKAFALAEKPSEVHFSKAKVLYALVEIGDSSITVDRVQEVLDEAIAIDNMPMYVSYKADMLLAAARYSDAYDCYMSLAGTELRGADIYARASQCQGALRNYDKAVELMDSAINMIGDDEQLAASPYMLTRALLKYSAGRYRESVFDYNRYEEVSGKMLNANFYSLRSQAEVKAKMYQQALNDLETAISIAPSNVALYIDKGILCYRLSLFEDAAEVLEDALELAPELSDIHYLLGCVHSKKGNLKAAVDYLRKALELGHPDAAARLEELESK